MLLEEVENHVATTTDVRWIHRHLAKEILHLWVKHSQGAQAIPEIIQGKDALAVLANILILNRNERTAQLHGVRHVILQELVGEMEHVAGGELWLALLVELPVPTQQITVTTDNLVGLRIPDDELLIAVVAKVEFVKIHRFPGSTASLTESDFTKAPNLLQYIWRVICRNDVNLVMALIGHAKLLVGSQLALQQLAVNRLDDFFFHTTLSLYKNYIL